MALLSKTKYLAGRQCPKRLWLSVHEPELGTYDASTTRRLEMGNEIGRRAHELFPGGVLVDRDGQRHDDAVERTAVLLAAPDVPAIFEAAFTHAGVRIRVDVLERLPDGAWGLREVKSTAGLKSVHLHDVAVQRFVLEGCGLRVPSVEVIHVDTSYVRGDGNVEWRRFFRRADVTALAEPLGQAIAGDVDAMHATLATGCPAVEPSRHCSSPYGCEFWAHCTKDKPDDWVFHLPGRSRLAALQALGIERIVDIPEEFPLSARQRRMRDGLLSGREYVSSDLADALAALDPPTAYLDFETMSPAIPLYAGTRPYERVPFQWSLHRVNRQGEMEHREFLADGRVDPRPAFVESLVAALAESSESIAVYSTFEDGVLGDLAAVVPSRADALSALRARLVDVLPIVRRHVYCPAFGGSFSLKDVAPALVPGFGYDDLTEIADGNAASEAFVAMVRGTASDAKGIRRALLAYCERDTWAMVELHRALRGRVV